MKFNISNKQRYAVRCKKKKENETKGLHRETERERECERSEENRKRCDGIHTYTER